MSELPHHVYIRATLEVANRIQQYADQLGTTMADALEIMVQCFDEHVGIEGEGDERGLTTVHKLEPNSWVASAIQTISKSDPTGAVEMAAQTRGTVQTFYQTSRGVRLPVGLKLFGIYRDVKHKAEVTAGGIAYKGGSYPDPSAAAVAVKREWGLSTASAQTNGWRFWSFEVGPFSRSLDWFRKNHEEANKWLLSNIHTFGAQ